MANREEDKSEEELDQLDYLRKLLGSRGGDVNDFDQQYVEPTAADNYGYINKPGFLSFLGMAPVPGAGMAATALNTGINLGNNQAIRTAQRMLGLPTEKPNLVRDMVKSPKDGFIGDMPIQGKNYPVGFEGKTKDNRTTLTPDEARKRGIASSPQPVPDAVKTAGKEKDDMDDGSNHLHAGLGLTSTPEGFRHIDDPDLPSRQMADVNYDLEGKGRSEVPSSGIGNKVSDVVTDMLGPGYSVDVTSGQEPEGRSPVGTQYRHPLGFAADLQIRDPEGRKLSLENPEDKQSIQDVAQGMAARYNANFGMGPEYMGNNTMHIDTMDLNKYRGGPEWASAGKEWADVLDNARATGVMPSQYYDISNPPVPGQRPEEPSYAISETDDPAQTDTQQGLGFMGRSTDTGKKDSSPLPSYDSLMNTQGQSSSIGIDPNRFKDITPEQKELMGMTLAGEIDPGRTDLTTEAGRREAMGILSTVENRAPKYGGITEAITAPNQYSTWNNQAASNTASTNYHGNKSTYDTLVSDFISNPANNLGFTSYHADTVNPGWSSSMQNKEQIGPHTFGFLDEYSKPETFNGPAPHTVFNTTASYAPHMSGMVSEVNTKSPAQQTETSSNKPASSGTGAGGFSGMGGGGSGAGSSGGSGTSMTGTSGNPGKDKDDKTSSSGFSGGRSY